MRLFFAVTPDSVARQLLTKLAEDVASMTGGRAPRAENLHLTVAFLGEVEQQRIADVEAMGATSATVSGPFVITFDRVGLFRDAGVAWIAPTETPAGLLRIVAALRNALQAARLRVDHRDFRAHMTLARRCTRPLSGVVAPRIQWRVEALALIASQTLPEGPHYRELAAWRLAEE
jgi:2'-5' RNA ligase